MIQSKPLVWMRNSAMHTSFMKKCGCGAPATRVLMANDAPQGYCCLSCGSAVIREVYPKYRERKVGNVHPHLDDPLMGGPSIEILQDK